MDCNPHQAIFLHKKVYQVNTVGTGHNSYDRVVITMTVVLLLWNTSFFPLLFFPIFYFIFSVVFQAEYYFHICNKWIVTLNMLFFLQKKFYQLNTVGTGCNSYDQVVITVITVVFQLWKSSFVPLFFFNFLLYFFCCLRDWILFSY